MKGVIVLNFGGWYDTIDRWLNMVTNFPQKNQQMEMDVVEATGSISLIATFMQIMCIVFTNSIYMPKQVKGTGKTFGVQVVKTVSERLCCGQILVLIKILLAGQGCMRSDYWSYAAKDVRYNHYLSESHSRACG